MPIKPGYSPLTVDGTALLAESVQFTTDVLFFERLEFSNERLKAAPDIDGKRPILVELPGGRITQLADGCVAPALRPLGTDDANIDLIYRRFDIKRWQITGEPTSAAFVDTIFALARDHKVLLDRFEARQKIVSGNVSYAFLVAAQADTFTFLTTTGKSMSGFALGDGTSNPTITNILITNFVPDVDYEEPLNTGYTSSRVLKRWSATIETRVDVPARSLTY